MRVRASHIPQFERYLKTQIPDFSVEFKDESRLMGLLGFLLGPFNDQFLSRYVTTWGTKVFFPSRAAYKTRLPLNVLMTLSHEFVHLWDSKKHGFWGFKRTYLTPQIYSLIPLLGYAIFGDVLSLGAMIASYLAACFVARKHKLLGQLVFAAGFLCSWGFGYWTSGLWSLLLPVAVGILFLPSPARTQWELRGYTMNIGVLQWLTGREPGDEYFNSMRDHFVGPDYLFMSWDKSKVERALEDSVLRAKSGTLQTSGPYLKVYEFLNKHDILHRREKRV
jgi:hypothetical protein